MVWDRVTGTTVGDGVYETTLNLCGDAGPGRPLVTETRHPRGPPDPGVDTPCCPVPLSEESSQSGESQTDGEVDTLGSGGWGRNRIGMVSERDRDPEVTEVTTERLTGPS